MLVPSYERPAALATTLTGLALQSDLDFGVVVSDQSQGGDPLSDPVVASVLRTLGTRARRVEVHRDHPRRGIAEHRAFLLSRSTADYVLFLDDDVLLLPEVVRRLHRAIRELRCGFVGAAPIALSYADDVRPEELETFEAVHDVVPERIRKGSLAWGRWRLHNAANPLHLQRRLGLSASSVDFVAYKVTWIPACVLYDRRVLVSCGGFSFWSQLPANLRGEEIVAQLRVAQRYGGAGILPSGAINLELPTTLPDREVDAYAVILEAADEIEDRAGA